ncbi:MAG: hypothetical protein JO307_26320 [Bryobacterales bacterium]|nr:hypothetical protein [Bryobacterales bacterium]
MEGQLAQFRGGGPEETYETVCLEGTRYANQNGEQNEEIHVYDRFWSDLSGVAKAGLRIFGELYQVLFHLGSVGVNNVRAAAISLYRQGADRQWNWFANAQSWAAAILAWPKPILNLLIAACAVALFASSGLSRLSATAEVLTAAIAVLALAIGFWGRALQHRGIFGTKAFRAPILTFLLVGFALGAFVLTKPAYFDQNRKIWSEIAEAIAALLVMSIAYSGIWLLMRAYDRRRPGTKQVFAIFAVLSLLGVVVFAIRLPTPTSR